MTTTIETKLLELINKIKSKINEKADSASVYTKEEVDAIAQTGWIDLEAKYFLLKHSEYIGQNSDFVFACVPDMHMCFDFMREYHIPFLKSADKMNNQCNMVISSGDILFNGNSSITKQQLIDTYIPKYKQMVQAFADNNMAFAAGLGGHDFNCFNRVGNIDYSVGNNLTKAEQREHLIQPCVNAIKGNSYLSSRYDIVISDDANVCYYYIKDKRTGNITVMLDETSHPYTLNGSNLVYNTYDTVCYTQGQLEWVVDILNNLPEGKYVCFHNHMGIGMGTSNDVANTCNALREILKAYINRSVYAGGNGSDLYGFSWTIPSVDFKNKKGLVVGVFKGHIHTQTYEYIDNTIHQIGSTNPDGYPFGTNAYCYNSLYSGDIYSIRDREIRNFHYGRKSYKNGGTQAWIYNGFVDRWLATPKQIANNEPVPDITDNYNILQTLTTVKRNQNGQWYFAIPQNGSLLGEIKIYSTAIAGVPSTVGQYTLADDSYTPTGGDYVVKGVVSYDGTTGILTINDSGVIIARTNGYIMIANNLTQDSIAYIVEEKTTEEPEEPSEDKYEVVSELQLVKRSQNNRWYFAIPADGVTLGEVLIRSTEITSIPYSVSQATYTNDSYTWTGGDYKNKGLLSYNDEDGVLTINDDGTISKRANGYILIDNNFTQNSKGYIVRLKG